MRFKRFDLNLLVVLDTLLRERSVSKAAEQLNLSQPATSAALGRLRQYFNDEILVLRGRRMVPTPHAQGITPIVAKALADIEALISASTVFDPATSQRTFRICASDYVTVVLLLPLLSELEKSAPNLRIEITPPSPEALPALERGEIDFLLTPEQYTAKDHPRKLLFEERHVVVGWNENPIFREPLTEEKFLEQGQVVIALSHAPSFSEQEMGELNRRRRIDIVCSSFLAVPWLLPNTRRLAVMHERLARIMTGKHPLAIAPLPFAFPPMREMVQHHAARDTDGGIQWFLQRILERAAALRNESM
ncbi:MAG: LysR family transcriptional regulator [Gammaproteobacteria bacterium]|nr:LysR family transcriptional regulator [Gammaproteobacteria bacterium]